MFRSAPSLPGTVLGIGDTEVSKTASSLLSWSLSSNGESGWKWEDKYMNTLLTGTNRCRGKGRSVRLQRDWGVGWECVWGYWFRHSLQRGISVAHDNPWTGRMHSPCSLQGKKELCDFREQKEGGELATVSKWGEMRLVTWQDQIMRLCQGMIRRKNSQRPKKLKVKDLLQGKQWDVLSLHRWPPLGLSATCSQCWRCQARRIGPFPV